MLRVRIIKGQMVPLMVHQEPLVAKEDRLLLTVQVQAQAAKNQVSLTLLSQAHLQVKIGLVDLEGVHLDLEEILHRFLMIQRELMVQGPKILREVRIPQMIQRRPVEDLVDAYRLAPMDLTRGPRMTHQNQQVPMMMIALDYTLTTMAMDLTLDHPKCLHTLPQLGEITQPNLGIELTLVQQQVVDFPAHSNQTRLLEEVDLDRGPRSNTVTQQEHREKIRTSQAPGLPHLVRNHPLHTTITDLVLVDRQIQTLLTREALEITMTLRRRDRVIIGTDRVVEILHPMTIRISLLIHMVETEGLTKENRLRRDHRTEIIHQDTLILQTLVDLVLATTPCTHQMEITKARTELRLQVLVHHLCRAQHDLLVALVLRIITLDRTLLLTQRTQQVTTLKHHTKDLVTLRADRSMTILGHLKIKTDQEGPTLRSHLILTLTITINIQTRLMTTEIQALLSINQGLLIILLTDKMHRIMEVQILKDSQAVDQGKTIMANLGLIQDTEAIQMTPDKEVPRMIQDTGDTLMTQDLELTQMILDMEATLMTQDLVVIQMILGTEVIQMTQDR